MVRVRLLNPHSALQWIIARRKQNSEELQVHCMLIAGLFGIDMKLEENGIRVITPP